MNNIHAKVMNDQKVDEIIEDWLSDLPYSGADLFFSSDSSSDSCDDELDEEKPQDPQRICILGFVQHTVSQYTEVEFQSHFQLHRATVDLLIERFRQTTFLNTKRLNDNEVPHRSAFLMTLWYLANTENFRQIAERFSFSKSTAYKILIKTLNFITSLTNEYIKIPATDEERAETSRKFAIIQNIQRVIGVIDCSHIRIKKPEKQEVDYLNHKGYHSIILQAVVNTDKLFMDVYVEEPGSMHDSGVLRRSPLYEAAMRNRQLFNGYYLIGDSAYPAMPWLLPPFPDDGHLTEQQRLFNYRHSSTRMVVEYTFGLLKSKFRRLFRLNNLPLDVIIECVMAACVLHNICILEGNNGS